MDWSEERYVRIYTRDTADLLAVGWEGRLVWYEILRHANRAGRIDDADADVLPELLRIPREIVDVGLPRLIARGMAVIAARNETSPSLVVPNFVPAQEAVASGKARQRSLRERRRENPECDEALRARDEALRASEVSDEALQKVTRSNPVPYRTVPCLDLDHVRVTDRDSPESEASATPRKPARSRSLKPRFDLEAVYRRYPKRTGKAKGLTVLARVVTEPEDYARLVACVDAMASAWAGHDTTYCPGFLPFVNGRRWQDEHWPLPGNAPSNGTPSAAAELEARRAALEAQGIDPLGPLFPDEGDAFK